MLKENWTKNEKINYSDFNLILADIQHWAQILNSNYSLSELSLGDFLFCEKLQLIEDTIDSICSHASIRFNKKKWYNLTTISYEDINRWAIALNSVGIARNITDELNNTLITEDGINLITEV